MGEHALRGTQFRNVYPYLLYSAKLFQVLAKSPEYAALLGAEDQVVTLLLSANHCSDGPRRLSSDLEGRCLALEALSSLAHFRLWPPQPQPTQSDVSATVALSSAFVARDLPLLLMDEHIGIRAAAVALWARLNPSEVQFTLLVGRHLEVEGKLPSTVWRHKDSKSADLGRRAHGHVTCDLHTGLTECISSVIRYARMRCDLVLGRSSSRLAVGFAHVVEVT